MLFRKVVLTMCMARMVTARSVSQQISVNAFANGIGAEVVGARLNELTDADFDVIHDALLRYKVVAVRNQQDLTVESQRSLTKRFGQLHVHLESSSHLPGYKDVNVVSNIKNENGSYIGLYGAHVENFHSDLSWHPLPTKVTIVKSEIKPAKFGDTLFADSNAAYDGLSPELKQTLNGLTGVYSYLKLRDLKQAEEKERVDQLDAKEVQAAAKFATHPLVTTHPITGRKNLFANPSHTVSVQGWEAEKSAQLLQYLFEHTAREEYSYRHKYEEGDLIIWDNRAVQHKATGCPDEYPRKLVRTTASNDDIPRENITVAAPFDLAADRRRSEHYHPELAKGTHSEEL